MNMTCKKGKHFGCVLLALWLVIGTLLPVGASVISDDAGSGVIWMELAPMEQFGGSSDASVTVDGSVELAEGTAEKWIDRVVLPASIRLLYDTLVEGSDNDGDRDILIEDSYYCDTEFAIQVATETVPLNGQTPSEVVEDVEKLYLPFLYAVFGAFDRDHPEVFWLDNEWRIGCSYTYTDTECTVSVLIRIDQARATQYSNQTAIKAAIAQRDAAVAEICEDFTWETSRYERVAHFNEVLTKANQYNTSSNLNAIGHDCRECISALIGKTGTEGPVCEGYARAFKVLCDANDIPCVLVDGVASSKVGASEAHMWNYVQMGEQWYAVDVTWNDPSVQNSTGAVSGQESEEWLLVGANTVMDGRTFTQTHTMNNRVYLIDSVPAFSNGPVLASDAYESALNVALNVPVGGYVYDGTVKEPQVTVKFNGTELNPSSDYTVAYTNHRNAGTATVTVTGKGLYAGVAKETFVIRPKELTPTVTVADKVYDGTDTAQVNVSWDSTALVAGDENVTLDAEGVFVSVKARKDIEVKVTLTLSGEGSENYTVRNPSELYATITRRAVTVRADEISVTSDEFEGWLTYTVDSSTPLVEGERLVGKLNFEERDGDGDVYDIVQGTLTNESNPNYDITFVAATLTFLSDNEELESDDDVRAPLTGDDLLASLGTDWWIYAAVGGGALVVLILVIVIAASIRKHRRR